MELSKKEEQGYKARNLSLKYPKNTENVTGAPWNWRPLKYHKLGAKNVCELICNFIVVSSTH